MSPDLADLARVLLTADGLVFYDQFGLLKPYQIALVSIGVAVLLLGVWVVALIQPAGQGGVDVGTWAEDDCSSTGSNYEPTENETLLGGVAVDEPEEDATSPTPHPQPEGFTHSPLSPRSGINSPLSPNRRRSRGPRYGTLIPDYDQHHVVPTGFSIGLGAASPGFVLRAEPHPHGSHGHGQRGRTRSEGQAAILRMMQGDQSAESAEDSPGPANEMNRRRSGDLGSETESPGWNTELGRRRGSWWRSLFSAGRSEGNIRLGAGAGDGGAGEGSEGQ